MLTAQSFDDFVIYIKGKFARKRREAVGLMSVGKLQMWGFRLP